MKTKKATVPLASLRERRIALGLSQAKLAAELGVAPMTVSRWELGAMGVARPGWLDVMLGLLELRHRRVANGGSVDGGGSVEGN